MPDLTGKIVLVTGASSGIGAALAQAFSQAGALVALTARRRAGLDKTAGLCPGETLVIPGDVTSAEDRRSTVERVLDRWNRLDVLVNNAGLGGYGDFDQVDEEEWRRLFEINLFAPVFLIKEVLPIMRRQASGLILNIASIGGLVAHSDKVTPYVASKHALVGLSRGLVKDLAGAGIVVKAACPHLTDTEFFAVSPGAEEMAPLMNKYKDFMDSPQDVAQGIIDALDDDGLIIFPTTKPAKAYLRMKDL